MKRKKQKHVLLTLLILLILAGIGYFFLLRYNADQEKKEAESTKEQTDLTVYPKKFNSSSISFIQYGYNADTLAFSLKKDKETWQYDANKKFPLNQSSLSGMKNSLQTLKASRKISDSLENAADYGLDQPSSYVTVKDQDGTEFTIYFGNTNQFSDITYISTSAKDGIYTIDSEIPGYFSHPLLDMIQADELPLPDSTAIFQKIAILRGEEKLNFTYKKKGDPALDYLDQCTWFADINGDKFAMDDSAVTALTEAVSSLSTSGCAAYDISKKEMAAYGLDKPTAVISLKYTQQEASEEKTVSVKHSLQLTVGKAVDSYYYVTWNNISQVYRMEASVLEPFLNCSRSSLIQMKPFNFLLSSVKAMTIQYQDLTFSYDTKEITGSDFTELFSSLQNASAEKLYPTEEGNAPIGDEAITFTVKLKSKKRSQVKLVLTPYDNNYFALYIDGTPSYLMNKNDVYTFIDHLPIEG